MHSIVGSMPRPLQESDLIFAPAASSFKTALGELKRSHLSITNRLQSIKQDAEFVLEVSEAYDLPLVANERCGSWYIPPDRKAGSAYFKSTDGHFGEWSFSLRRLNLQVLDVLGEYGGCIIVDSTRRGKSMPDALSKTIPIWIAVLNRLLFPQKSGYHGLHTPPDVVSLSEHAQIEARIPGFVESLRGLYLDLEQLRSTLMRPMLPVWITPGCAHDLSSIARQPDHSLVVLVTASNCTSGGSQNVSNYVQGAADDGESWALGLGPSTFWANNALLLNAPESALPSLIERIVAGSSKVSSVRLPTLIKPSNNIWIANNASAEQVYAEFDIIICCSVTADTVLKTALESSYIHLACSNGKNGSRQLRTELPELRVLASKILQSSRILVTCETGKDLAVGVALAILCTLYSSDGRLRLDSTDEAPDFVSKTLIKHRLSWIMVSIPDAAPSRATLQSVNAYLMG
ncbi:tRNA A64-2'-O-ribosylphosphate transferase [Friedmanniomyces endolithicus]|uniref:tRNA A64-2'-O-ribosylphosphate transferase n=1 Tax=Friedmanniomyces endolithicus TaxID=329885 RepID=A0AAN6FWD4_9PEZI|nr:tRNA A64-2'-O-ribosylphosphate transferase [Friedmanniomyces endolithicus]KAK0282588.1 tRNA A64-2'-O-ribosylphosphate transferase [Friedmanniomyces endolithicus]KAK0324678.1 tRNA A64-2'-O-ribosylphosphate transferase [Friedmanniomyces endolithicus]KAK0932154.1 tRNA A64-2'-O-ribosylphosphate transferase [Friedmanniomyces endolithicus]KAK0992335.1 tRNA A64-2'-O-ribosylphosphate transferase [Friedmanniomyces endolithicus]